MNYTFITTAAGARRAMVHLGKGPDLYLDSETTGPTSQDGGLCPHKGRLRLLQMQNGDGKIFVSDCYKVDPCIYAPLLMAKRLIGHHIKFDAKFLRKIGIFPDNFWDTMLASQIFTAGHKMVRHGLGQVLSDVLDIEADKTLQKSDWFPNELSDEQLEYAAVDVLYLPKLHHTFMDLMKEDGLLTTAALDMQLIAPAAWMEFQGIRLDVDALPPATIASAKILEELRKKCAKLAKSEGFNPNSPQQVKAFFHQFKKYQGLQSFKKSVLEVIDHPLGEPLLEFRGLSKLMGSYLEKFPNHINPLTGNIHCNINIDPTSTGRMSTSSMSLQNIPAAGEAGKITRKLFIPEREHMMVVADYGQIELRLMALLSMDPNMVQAYVNDVDIHNNTTELIFGLKEGDPAWEDSRKVAKNCNFMIGYGGSATRLMTTSRGIIKTEARGQEIIDGWWKAYPEVRTFFDSVVRHAYKYRESRTLIGRRREYPQDGRSYASIKRQAQNHVIQGTSADITKAAIIEAWRMGLDMRLPVHDEILCISKADAAEHDAWKLEKAMIGGAAKILACAKFPISHDVPIVADAGIGMSWADAKTGTKKKPVPTT